MQRPRSARSSTSSTRPSSSPRTPRDVRGLVGGASKALVLGIGGGGDVVGALAAARMCQTLGCEFVLGGVAWERTPVDPHPGPRTLAELREAEPISGSVALAGPATCTPEGALFSESRMAKHLGVPTVLVDICDGPRATGAGIVDAATRLGCDLALYVDIGGDVLARGDEPGLGSPLCDAIMLSAAVSATGEGLPSLLGVLGAGCDGELTPNEVLLRSAELAAGGAWAGAWAVEPAVAEEIVRAAESTATEASLQLARCALGESGEAPIRDGRRTVRMSPLGGIGLYFDPVRAVEAACPLAGAVASAPSLGAANAALNEIGVRTELGYELARGTPQGGAAPKRLS